MIVTSFALQNYNDVNTTIGDFFTFSILWKPSLLKQFMYYFVILQAHV